MYQFITMFENLQQSDCDRMESEKSTSSPEDSRVRTLAARVKELASMIQTGKLPEAVCGQSTPESLAKLSPNGLWLKMSGDSCQSLLWDSQGEDSELFSGTWPIWGIVLDGVAMALPMLERRTEGNGCSSWPTITAECGDHPGRKKYKPGQQLHLTGAVWPQNWPTPKTPTGGGQVQRNTPGGGIRKLEDAVSGEIGYNTGQLNSDWVEILMNYPIGYTDLDVDKLQEWPGWPAGMGAREWMTPQAGQCGSTARTSGRPLEMSTHLQAQVTVAEKAWATPSAGDAQGTTGGGQGRSLRTDTRCASNGQYPYEPPRVIQGQKSRAKRLKCLGNSVLPLQAYPIFKAIMDIEKEIKT